MSTAIQPPASLLATGCSSNAKHIKTERPVKSLDHKNMGPYQITRVIDNMAYELDLPDSLKNIFPAFHPWLLQPYEDDALPGQPRANDNAPPEVHLNDEGDTEYVIAQVLDSRIRNTMNDPILAAVVASSTKLNGSATTSLKAGNPTSTCAAARSQSRTFTTATLGALGLTPPFMIMTTTGSLPLPCFVFSMEV
ncbi:hypothetical protein A1F94_013036 [Pyrenophora tritici-repentis]|nr:hypothetical protein A1F94_013036 [Pyrenophora tritici-repentis]